MQAIALCICHGLENRLCFTIFQLAMFLVEYIETLYEHVLDCFIDISCFSCK